MQDIKERKKKEEGEWEREELSRVVNHRKKSWMYVFTQPHSRAN